MLHDSKNFYIVTEYASGTDLRSYLFRRIDGDMPKFSEHSVKFIALQLLTAINMLHQKRIVHSKIRLEKLLVYKVNSQYNRFLIKLAETTNSEQLSFTNP